METPVTSDTGSRTGSPRRVSWPTVELASEDHQGSRASQTKCTQGVCQPSGLQVTPVLNRLTPASPAPETGEEHGSP